MSYLTGYDQHVMQSRHASFHGRWNLYFGSERMGRDGMLGVGVHEKLTGLVLSTKFVGEMVVR